jgi:hypothetical protein
MALLRRLTVRHLSVVALPLALVLALVPALLPQTLNKAGGGSSSNYPNLTQNADGTIVAAKALTSGTASASATTCDWSASNTCIITAAGSNPTVTFSNPHGSGPYWLILNNDASARTWTLPVTLLQSCPPSIASTGTIQPITFDGTNYQGGACNSNETPTILRGIERGAPAATASGYAACWLDQTDHTGLECIANGSGTVYKMVANVTSPAQAGTPFVILSNQLPAADTLSCATINTTETAFTTNYTIPGNLFDVGKVLRVTAGFEQIGTAAGATVTPKMRLGSTAGSIAGTLVYTSFGGTVASGTNESGFMLDLLGTAAPGASVAVKSALKGSVSGFARSTSAYSNALATNATLLLQMTLTCTANTASTSFQLTNLMIEAN